MTDDAGVKTSGKAVPAKSAAPAPRPREADATRRRILDAAKAEFARLGLAGARVDAIALRAKANKRMIYHYFGSKEGLYVAILDDAYGAIRAAEQQLKLDDLAPEDAIRKLVTFTWNYFIRNPEFLTLVNTENLYRARYLKKSTVIRELHTPLIEMVRSILERGVAAGTFRPGLDPVQVNLTIAAVGYHYLNNRFTGSIIYDRDLNAREALDERLAFNIETILRLICRD
nr:TetR family transcriptional regulator [Ancylobacter sp. FA202]